MYTEEKDSSSGGGDDDEEERAFLTSLVAGGVGETQRQGRVRLDTRTKPKLY